MTRSVASFALAGVLLALSVLQERGWEVDLVRTVVAGVLTQWKWTRIVVLVAAGMHMSLVDLQLATAVILLTPISTVTDIVNVIIRAAWLFFVPVAINRCIYSHPQPYFLVLACASSLRVYIWILTRSLRDRRLSLHYVHEEASAIRQEVSSLLRRNVPSQSTSRRASIEGRQLLSKLKRLNLPESPGKMSVESLRFQRRGSNNSDSSSLPSFEMSLSKGFDDSNLSGFPGNESSITSQNSPDLSKDEIDLLINTIMRQEYMLWTYKKKRRERPEQVSMALSALLQVAASSPRGSQSEFNPEIKVAIPLKVLMEENEELADVMLHSGEWDFNTLELVRCTKEPLREVSYYLFSTHSIPEKFSIRREALQGFLRAVESRYLTSNFYHNSVHAVDVLNSVVFLLSSGLHRCGHFLDIEVFGLLIAAIAHDISHPGVNNSFLINKGDRLAMMYNDRSVLEMMHASSLFFIFRRQECNILSGVRVADAKHIRKVIVALILATDLQRHFSMQADYRYMLEEQGKNLTDEDFRLSTLEICIKCADLGHSAKSTAIHRLWTDLITQEFFSQGDKELALGLPVSPLCDRRGVSVPTSQIGFLTVMVKPLYGLWEELLRKCGEWEEAPPFEICLQHLNDNILYWEEWVKAEEDTPYTFALTHPPLIPSP